MLHKTPRVQRLRARRRVWAVVRLASNSSREASEVHRRRRTDLRIAWSVLGVAGLACVGALVAAGIGPRLLAPPAPSQTEAALKAQVGANFAAALDAQRVQDQAMEVAAAVEQALGAKARAEGVAGEARAVLARARAALAGGGANLVRQRTPEGDLYEGEAESGRPQGYGLVQRASGGFGASYFIDGESRGPGVFCASQSCQGASYFGDYRHNAPTGFGVGVSGDGGVYRGEFKAGVPDGYGEYVYANGAVYRGGFVAGERQGYGELRAKSGAVQAGFWRKNQLLTPTQAAPAPTPSTQSLPPPGDAR